MKIGYLLCALSISSVFAAKQDLDGVCGAEQRPVLPHTVAGSESQTPEPAAHSCLTIKVGVRQSLPFINQGKTITLPFEYVEPGALDEASSLMYLGQSFCTVLKDGDNRKVMVGPFQPCVFVGVRDAKQGITVIGSKDFINNIESFVEIAKDAFGAFSSEDLEGLVWSVNIKERYTALNNLTNGSQSSWKKAHEGRSQVEEIKKVKDALVEGFVIKDRTRIRAFLFTKGNENIEASDIIIGNKIIGHKIVRNFRSPVQSSVLVGSDLIPKSFCWRQEKFFSKYCDQVKAFKEGKRQGIHEVELYVSMRDHLKSIIEKRTGELALKKGMSLKELACPSYGAIDFYNLVFEKDLFPEKANEESASS